MAKLVHKITAFQEMEACGSHNLCARLKADIEGAVHASERDFGRKTPPNTVSSDSHTKGANGLETVYGRGDPNPRTHRMKRRQRGHCSPSHRHTGKETGRPTMEEV